MIPMKANAAAVHRLSTGKPAFDRQLSCGHEAGHLPADS